MSDDQLVQDIRESIAHVDRAIELVEQLDDHHESFDEMSLARCKLGRALDNACSADDVDPGKLATFTRGQDPRGDGEPYEQFTVGIDCDFDDLGGEA